MREAFFGLKCNPRRGLGVSRCRDVIKQGLTEPKSSAVAKSAGMTAVAGCAVSAGAPPAGDPGAPVTAFHNANDDTWKDQGLTNRVAWSN
jgi:hypothetical protein